MKILIITAFLLTLCHQRALTFPQEPLSDEYIEWVQSKATTWKAGRNFHKKTSIKYLKRLLGARDDNSIFNMDKNSYEKQMGPPPPNYELPENFDAREKWPHCPTINEIRDQGSCGSSWAIAPVSVMSDRTCIQSGGKINFRYSTEDVLACCTSCGDGCDGGWQSSAYSYWLSIGIVSGGAYKSRQGCAPYLVPPCEHHVNGTRPNCDWDYRTPACMTDCEGYYPVQYQDDLHKGVKAYIFNGLQYVLYDLVFNGPISTKFNVYQDFFTYKSGVYQHTNTSEKFLGTTAVRIIGYGVEEGVPYWLCANSWNTDWGDQGLFKILRGHNECSVEIALMAGMPKL